MMPGFAGSYLGRVLWWHLLVLLLLLIVSQVVRALEPDALILGWAFMGLNFCLISLGTRWVLSPTASRKRQRWGVALLVLKLLLFLGLMSAVFFRMALDGVSFVVGVTSLLIASVIGALSSTRSYRMT